MAAKRKQPKPFSRSGLHRLECVCGNYTYSTVSAIETYGMPVCSRCSAPFEPSRVELALLLGCDDAPVMVFYRSKCSSVAHGQVAHVAKGRECESPEFRALYGSKDEPGIVQQQRQQSRERRLNALKPALEAMPF